MKHQSPSEEEDALDEATTSHAQKPRQRQEHGFHPHAVGWCNVRLFAIDGVVEVPKTGRQRRMFAILLSLLVVCLSVFSDTMFVARTSFKSSHADWKMSAFMAIVTSPATSLLQTQKLTPIQSAMKPLVSFFHASGCPRHHQGTSGSDKEVPCRWHRSSVQMISVAASVLL